MTYICSWCQNSFDRPSYKVRKPDTFCNNFCRARWVALQRQKATKAKRVIKEPPSGVSWRYLPVSGDRHVMIDATDFDVAMRWCWSFDGNYVMRWEKKKKIYLHRWITATPPGMHTDHRDGNRFDCRRSNLRICTPAENARNTRLRVDNTTGYRGVYWNKQKQQWQAIIHHKGRNYHLGFFTDKTKAAICWNQAAIERFGDFARLNTL